jgi:Transposase and inactivated derivatives
MSCFEGTREWRSFWNRLENQILQAEMTEHLRAKPGEQTLGRRGYRNGTYERKLTTRAHAIELEVPRDREGTFQTALFQRYQRSEKALVLTLMQYGPPGSQHRSSQGSHHGAQRQRVFKVDSFSLEQGS